VLRCKVIPSVNSESDILINSFETAGRVKVTQKHILNVMVEEMSIGLMSQFLLNVDLNLKRRNLCVCVCVC
jgi:hypothetical protein